MARRKTIGDIRNELWLEKDKTRKLRQALADIRREMWLRATAIAEGVAADYPESIFAAPGPDSPPDSYSAAGARLAAERISKECMRRAAQESK
ncbi:hypothetical protein LCGC14_1281400 [marine sediment metagenome]|uniref:Uncharacterized protein n=1 Tax=marine sediment metagenome TaxID=412755 RepID=A0A0F9KV26_9ZZZZ